MKKTPWKGICIGSLVMTVLVLARCVATAARELYYGRSQWINLILQDPWFYVGIATAAVACITATVCLLDKRKPLPTADEDEETAQ